MTISLNAALVVVASCLCALAVGCTKHDAVPPAQTKTSDNGEIRVSVRIDPAIAAEGVCVRGEVNVDNISDRDIVIFDDDDPTLPTILQVPGGEADVFYGLSPQPSYGEWLAEQSPRCYILGPGERYRYIFTVWNPLDERGPWGNPWYDDPASPHYYKPSVFEDPEAPTFNWEPPRPAEMRIWRQLRVRMGYLSFQRYKPLRALRGDNMKSNEIEVEIDGIVHGPLTLQKEVAVNFEVGAGHQ